MAWDTYMRLEVRSHLDQCTGPSGPGSKDTESDHAPCALIRRPTGRQRTQRGLYQKGSLIIYQVFILREHWNCIFQMQPTNSSDRSQLTALANSLQSVPGIKKHSRTRTNTNPDGTEANAAGRSGNARALRKQSKCGMIHLDLPIIELNP